MELIKKYFELSSASPTGLVWRESPHARVLIGTPALINKDKDGYFRGLLKRKAYRAHRVVFYLAYDYLPDIVDHIDGDVTNNAIDNLRAANTQINNHNLVCSGFTKNKITGRYQAKIMVDGKRKYLGYYDTPEEAREAYLIAKAALHPTAPSRCYGAHLGTT